MKKVIIYARVSTKNQDTESQIFKLKEYCSNHNYEIKEIFEDVWTGRNNKRANYQKLLNEIHLKSFDTLLVWKLNRLSRNTKELIEIGEKLGHKWIDLVTYDWLIDTSSAMGKMLYQLLAVLAEFEADNIRENIKAWMDKAKAKGKKIGRPTTFKNKITQKTLEMAYSLKNTQKMSYRKIAKELNIRNVTGLFEALKQYEEDIQKGVVKNNSTLYDYM